jgi:hypothetical protein
MKKTTVIAILNIDANDLNLENQKTAAHTNDVWMMILEIVVALVNINVAMIEEITSILYPWVVTITEEDAVAIEECVVVDAVQVI